ncbi:MULTISPECIES: MFS transporter [Cryobacterium]|uniref:MFS transporter n=1 Tax=Cryobacterium levicorallinum TaxID=995038 RepID=A0A1I3AHE8_9MICO|nr:MULTISPECIES: MFS transporter [Cryobacterium]TFB86596.1 MFS transporter [Cryobacterium levicorallinum]TFD59516.1 MFS transporter [Cryobacterium sp. Hh38]GEP26554.1 MFS transporter [Cryobacterium levicorallinum]SFH49492.1 Predicted arabinose efflux permease, MFS family [Cryobacterium levicorallinum]
MSNHERPFSLRSVALVAFLPTLLFSIGEGAIIPLIPLVATDLGASLAIAGVIAAMVMLGELVGDIPSGWIVSRIGERNAMIWASALTIGAVIVCIVAPNPLVLGLGIFLVGLATAIFALARHAFMTNYVPLVYRARALSTLGGVFRAGWFVGPFLSAGLIHLTGGTQAVFWVFIICCVAASATLLLLPDPSKTFATPSADTTIFDATDTSTGAISSTGTARPAVPVQGLFQTIWSHRGVLLRLGTGAGLIGAMRASRTVMLPLWAVSIGISAPDTALIIGIAGGIDFALFYVSGQIMDRFGRIWSALPSMIGLGAGHLALAFTHDLPSNVGWFIGVAMFLSLANGVGSGLLMTLGADLAPRPNPAPFLGAWRFTADFGSAAAPLAVAGITALVSLSVASGVMGAIGLCGAVLLRRYIPRYAPHRPGRLL